MKKKTGKKKQEKKRKFPPFFAKLEKTVRLKQISQNKLQTKQILRGADGERERRRKRRMKRKRKRRKRRRKRSMRRKWQKSRGRKTQFRFLKETNDEFCATSV